MTKLCGFDILFSMRQIVLSLTLLALTGLAWGQAREASGTGFFVSEDIIVTCAHVIDGFDAITVTANGKEYNAAVLTKNTVADLAVLKIDYKSPHSFKIADSDAVNLGDKVYVLGFPLSGLLGSDIRVTDGIISAKSGINANQTYFQISAPVQPGNSGGPIVNDTFEVIGIAASRLSDLAAIEASGAIPQNINFGVKSKNITPLLTGAPRTGGVKNLGDAAKATVLIQCKTSTFSVKITNKTGTMVERV